MISYLLPKLTDYLESFGCFKDTGDRAIPTIEGSDSILDGNYEARQHALSKCAVAALRKGFSMFAVQHGGWCASSDTAGNTFDKYGKYTTCGNDGEGGPAGNNVYLIGEKEQANLIDFHQIIGVCLYGFFG